MDLPPVDVVDIVDLTDAPDHSSTRVTGGLVDAIASAWRLLSATEGAPPHEPREPRWGLRFYMKGALLEEASICRKSGTIQSKGGTFVALFDRMSEQSQRLLAAVRDARMRATLLANVAETSRVGAAEFAGAPELWRRSQGCPYCRADTIQLLHGADAVGRLWKGHLCACRGWQCTRCFAVLEQQHGCCK